MTTQYRSNLIRILLRTVALLAACFLATSLATSVAAAPSAQEKWHLHPDSTLSFLTTKDTHITEVSQFTRLSGSITSDGLATLNIELASVQTGVGPRDIRLKSILFNLADFPQANVSLQLPDGLIDEVVSGNAVTSQVEVSLTLEGQSRMLRAKVIASPTPDGRVIVTPVAPIMLDAGSFGLLEEIEILRQIATLSSISETVPVLFTLIYQKSKITDETESALLTLTPQVKTSFCQRLSPCKGTYPDGRAPAQPTGPDGVSASPK